ncbi:MAG: cytochrome P450 [Micromonosporaceae bacterium]|nr:cytochrome P450 [Micromonosporaceae bacterium]
MSQQVSDAEIPFDHNSPEFHEDPYGWYRRLREAAPVYRHESGSWLLTRHRDCLFALEDPRFRNVENVRCYSDEAVQSTPDGDGADFVKLRKAVAKAIAPAAVRRFQPTIQRIVDGLLDDALDAGQVELMRDFCYPLATIVFCEIFGIPTRDRTMFRNWIEPIVEGLDVAMGLSQEVVERSTRAREEFSDYLRELVAERRSHPEDDLLTDFIQIQQDGRRLTVDELVSSSIILLVAGHETSASIAGNAILTLLRNPAELNLLRDDPDLWPLAFEELLRYDPPAQLITRAASVDIEVGGRQLQENDIVVSVIAAANRDPEVFTDPDRLDLRRTPNPHIAFGHGPHYCLGTALARMEGITALETLVKRAPGLSLTDDSPSYKPTVTRRALETLWARLR